MKNKSHSVAHEKVRARFRKFFLDALSEKGKRRIAERKLDISSTATSQAAPIVSKATGGIFYGS